MPNELTTTQATRLHVLRQELLGLAATATEHFCRMGVIMKEIRDKELWVGEYESFAAFYGDPAFSFKKSSVYHAIRLVEVFPDWENLIDVPVSKLIMIAPHLEDKNKEELVEKARSLSISDLYYEVGLHLKGKPSAEPAPLPKVYPCNVCNGAKGISFDLLCHCGWTNEQVIYISKLIDHVNLGGDTLEEIR